VLAKTPRLKRFFFSATLLSSKVKTVALTRAPENVGENHDKVSKHPTDKVSKQNTQTGWPY